MASESEWWEQPYPGAPMVAVKGFPRPLYPPDDPRGSIDGPDVIAYKRAVSRAGRWPWGVFDDSYSNQFAHGKPGGNVADSGVAGVQRQLGLDSTGFIGEATFNGLRSIRIPDGLPHAGEMAMDANAVDLINQAYAIFNTAPVGKLIRKQILTPNCSSRNGATVRLIVLHTAEGALTIESLGAFFANQATNASSHVGIDDTPGVIGEYVHRGDKAWTSVNANPVAVQAELCAFASWTAAEWDDHPDMLENCARWIAEEAKAFDIPIVKLTANQAQGNGRGVCQHRDLGSWGGGHHDCGDGFPIDAVIKRANELGS
jgi:hypothetical protein